MKPGADGRVFERSALYSQGLTISTQRIATAPWGGGRPPVSSPKTRAARLVAHELEEVIDAGGAQVGIRALLVAEGVVPLWGIEVSGKQRRVVGQTAERGEAFVHRPRIAAWQVDAPTAVEKERVPGDELPRLIALGDQEALAAGRVAGGMEQLDGDGSKLEPIAPFVRDEVALGGAVECPGRVGEPVLGMSQVALAWEKDE